MNTEPITIQTVVNASLEKVWDYWKMPEHITHWAFASEDWEASGAENDLKVGGSFKTVMSAKDKSASFDFTGTYTVVEEHARIGYDMDDGSHVSTRFEEVPDGVEVTQTFDPETENSRDMQQQGWQAILDNFTKYVEKRK